MGCLRTQRPRFVALTLPPPTVRSPPQTAEDAGPHRDGPARHHHPQRELHPSLRWIELRGLGGERWSWGQEVAGSGTDQSILSQGGRCCKLSLAPVTVDADLGRLVSPASFAEPSPQAPHLPGAAAGVVGPPGHPPRGPRCGGQSCDQRLGVRVSYGHGGLLVTWVGGAGLGTT